MFCTEINHSGDVHWTFPRWQSFCAVSLRAPMEMYVFKSSQHCPFTINPSSVPGAWKGKSLCTEWLEHKLELRKKKTTTVPHQLSSRLEYLRNNLKVWKYKDNIILTALKSSPHLQEYRINIPTPYNQNTSRLWGNNKMKLKLSVTEKSGSHESVSSSTYGMF